MSAELELIYAGSQTHPYVLDKIPTSTLIPIPMDPPPVSEQTMK
jgi:hypothetical protein